jgi:DNA-directed RNA polymerase subunit RPC12/RpoP
MIPHEIDRHRSAALWVPDRYDKVVDDEKLGKFLGDDKEGQSEIHYVLETPGVNGFNDMLVQIEDRFAASLSEEQVEELAHAWDDYVTPKVGRREAGTEVTGPPGDPTPACHFTGPDEQHGPPDPRATEQYGEPVCLDCAVKNHRSWDPCDHNDEHCPWTWAADPRTAKYEGVSGPEGDAATSSDWELVRCPHCTSRVARWAIEGGNCPICGADPFVEPTSQGSEEQERAAEVEESRPKVVDKRRRSRRQAGGETGIDAPDGRIPDEAYDGLDDFLRRKQKEKHERREEDVDPIAPGNRRGKVAAEDELFDYPEDAEVHCPECGSADLELDDHEIDPGYRCRECGANFVDPEGDEDGTSAPADGNVVECVECGSVNVDEDDGEYTCLDCGAYFTEDDLGEVEEDPWSDGAEMRNPTVVGENPGQNVGPYTEGPRRAASKTAEIAPFAGEEDEEYVDEPQEDDAYISGRNEAYLSGKYLGKGEGDFPHDHAHYLIEQAMREEGFFPNIWDDNGHSCAMHHAESVRDEHLRQHPLIQFDMPCPECGSAAQADHPSVAESEGALHHDGKPAARDHLKICQDCNLTYDPCDFAEDYEDQVLEDAVGDRQDPFEEAEHSVNEAFGDIGPGAYKLLDEGKGPSKWSKIVREATWSQERHPQPITHEYGRRPPRPLMTGDTLIFEDGTSAPVTSHSDGLLQAGSQWGAAFLHRGPAEGDMSKVIWDSSVEEEAGRDVPKMTEAERDFLESNPTGPSRWSRTADRFDDIVGQPEDPKRKHIPEDVDDLEVGATYDEEDLNRIFDLHDGLYGCGGGYDPVEGSPDPHEGHNLEAKHPSAASGGKVGRTYCHDCGHDVEIAYPGANGEIKRHAIGPPEHELDPDPNCPNCMLAIKQQHFHMGHGTGPDKPYASGFYPDKCPDCWNDAYGNRNAGRKIGSHWYEHSIWEARPGQWYYGLHPQTYFPNESDGEDIEWDAEYDTSKISDVTGPFKTPDEAGDHMVGQYGNPADQASERERRDGSSRSGQTQSHSSDPSARDRMVEDARVEAVDECHGYLQALRWLREDRRGRL